MGGATLGLSPNWSLPCLLGKHRAGDLDFGAGYYSLSMILFYFFEKDAFSLLPLFPF